jgi:hypothetical protein
MDDCEFDRVGLPGRNINGAGEACESGATAGVALVKDGDAVVVGVGTGVTFVDGVGSVIDVFAIGWLYVG